MKEAFLEIFEKQRRKDIVPFLQTLTAEQKKELVPVIKALEKEYLTFQQITRFGVTSFGQKGNERHRIILLLSAFVCFKRADFEKFISSGSILEEHILEEVINWYCPDWFSDFVSGLVTRNLLFHTFNYAAVMNYTNRGLLIPSKELIVSVLPNFIYENRDRKNYFVPGKLLEYPATLAEHIWYLFELESTIMSVGNWFGYTPEAGRQKHEGWVTVFKQYAKTGKIDRQRVLRESLYASNRNFNKIASGWFIELFSELEPSKEELLSLQKELFAALGSPHSKPVNTTLQSIKKIIGDKAFEQAGFFDYLPALLSSAAKNTVASTLMILDKLAAKHADSRAMICSAVLQVFIHTDDDLQARAAKIIVANEASTDDSFKAELGAYAGTMLASARKLLGAFIDEATKEAANELPEMAVPVAARAGLTPIPAVDNIDDLVFMMSEAVDNNQSWHIDILPAALIKWIPELKGTQVARLEPALQRALKLVRPEMTATQGWLDQLLAVFMIEVCIFLVRTRGHHAATLDKLIAAHQQERIQQPAWRNASRDIPTLASWETDIGKSIYHSYKLLLLSALNKIRQGNPLPILSTPTHEPGWIVPDVLVKRLSVYQQHNQWPESMDLQVALSRCYKKDSSQAILLAEQQLQGEYLNLCLFLLGKHQEPQGPFHHGEAWMAAALALPEKKQYEAFASFGYSKDFRYYTGQFEWEVVDEEFMNSRYDYKLGKNIKFTDRRKQLRVLLPGRIKEEEKTGGFLKRVFSGFLSKPATPVMAAPELLYDRYRLHDQYAFGLENDIRRLLLLAPANPEPLLALIVKRFMEQPVFSGETDKRTVIAALQALLEIWDHPGDMAHLFIGASMLSSDKTAAGVAGEIWLQQGALGKIDNAQLGKAIGLQLRVEFVPLKRFTDLVTQQLMRVSALHNQQLLILVEHIVQELPDAPVKNLKKLLEIYLEVLDFNKATITNSLINDKLTAWIKTTGLQKIAAQLITYYK